jgi:Uncharacterized protein conserved in bacteria (DUF2252)
VTQTLQLSTPRVAHPTPGERAEAGKDARAKTPRSAHAVLELAPGRDPVPPIYGEDEGRLVDLVPIRHERMCASPFAFYRGTASLMGRDLASSPRSSLRVQLCGDAHLSNFGAYAAPDRQLVFDLNDFDETLPGPFEWDVKRLAASFEIAGRHRDLAPAARRKLARTAVATYRTTMRELATMSNLNVWYSRMDVARMNEMFGRLLDTKAGRAFREAGEKARAKDSARALGRLTEIVDGEPRFVSKPPLIVPVSEFVPDEEKRHELEDAIRELLRRYRRTLQADRRVLFEQYRYVDLAHKVVGVGSVGTRCWIALFLGRDPSDALVMQIKEASASALEPFLGRAGFTNHGQRVVEGQRLMQAASDIFLGWIRNPAGFDGNQRDFYVRQLWDWKGGFEIETAPTAALEPYALMCGWTLARAHARSGDRIAIASYLGKGDAFDNAVANFASDYADVAEADHVAFSASAQ